MPPPTSLPALLLCITLLAAGTLLPLRPASAAPHTLTADEIMALVNQLRRSQGLQPYVIDPAIAAYAQEHSDYQLRIKTSTHIHSDGQTSRSHGLVENVAAGSTDFITAQAVVYQIWADPVHMKTMVGYASGAAGVGVASDGTSDYVTLNVRPGDGVVRPASTGSSLGITPIALVPLVTSTMKPSGAVVHEVGYGQSLWAIALAYGVTAARIRELNGMAPDDSSIWAGQWLLIVPAGLVTPTPPPSAAAPTAAAAPALSAPTPIALRLTPTPAPAGLPSQALAASPAPPETGLASRLHIDPILAGLLGLIALGLILTLSSGIKINRRS